MHDDTRPVPPRQAGGRGATLKSTRSRLARIPPSGDGTGVQKSPQVSRSHAGAVVVAKSPELLSAALCYAARKWPVLPVHGIIGGACTCGDRECRSPGKHPRLLNGLKGATTNTGLITGWFTKWNNLNIAIRTGAGPDGAGLFAIDIDPHHGGDQSLAQLVEEHGKLPITVAARTGSGGSHLLFIYPDQSSIKNRAGVRPGIDVRGDGGYLIVSPSQHACGDTYGWRRGKGPADVPLAPAPAWLLDLIKRPSRKIPPSATTGDKHHNVASAVTAMLRIKVEDHNDGSKRLLAYACRCVECDLGDDAALLAIRTVAQVYPFPKDWTDDQMVQRIRDAEERASRGTRAPDAVTTDPGLPLVTLPGGSMRVCDAAAAIGELLDATGLYYNRGGALVTLVDGKAETIKIASMPSVFESVAALQRLDRSGEPVPTVCKESEARVIAAAAQFVDRIRPLQVISPTPVLIANEDGLRTIMGYDRASGIFAGGDLLGRGNLDFARAGLDVLLHDFDFATAGDKARAAAFLITPALVLGGLLGGRAPMLVAEADQSQAGKGYLFKVLSAIYGTRAHVIAQRKGGVGGLEESIGSALLRGSPFVMLDNWRGRLDCPALESALTEMTFECRAPYQPSASVDPSRTVFLLTSNGAELTRDMANRSLMVSIRKQPEGYEFVAHDEGDLIDHVSAERTMYLTAIFAAVRHWWDAGRPVLPVIGHDFRRYAGIMSWIIAELGYGPLLAGHSEAAVRAMTPALTWLRSLALSIERSKCLNKPLRANRLIDLIMREAEIVTPELDSIDLNSETGRENGMRRLGRLLGRVFYSKPTIDLGGGLIVTRETTKGSEADSYHDIKTYTFQRKEPARGE